MFCINLNLTETYKFCCIYVEMKVATLSEQNKTEECAHAY